MIVNISIDDDSIIHRHDDITIQVQLYDTYGNLITYLDESIAVDITIESDDAEDDHVTLKSTASVFNIIDGFADVTFQVQQVHSFYLWNP